jgi:hypothetical protein
MSILVEYFGAGGIGSTPTLQQVITQDPFLSGINTIFGTTGAESLNFNNFNVFAIQTTNFSVSDLNGTSVGLYIDSGADLLLGASTQIDRIRIKPTGSGIQLGTVDKLTTNNFNWLNINTDTGECFIGDFLSLTSGNGTHIKIYDTVSSMQIVAQSGIDFTSDHYTINSKNGSSVLEFKGTNWLAGTSGAALSTYLKVTVNNTPYVIQLRNP